MINANKEVRKSKGYIPNWRIASKINVSEMTLTRWMRTEMPVDKRDKVLSAINDIKREMMEA